MLGDLRHRAGHGHFPSTLMERESPLGTQPSSKMEGMFSDQCVTGWPRTDKRRYCQSNELLKSSRLPVWLQEETPSRS